MGWKEDATSDGGQADKLPKGHHYLRIDKIVFGKKDGAPFQSSKGDPQIMLIFTDDGEREAAQMFTLSRKARWTLARLLSRCGQDALLDELEAADADPADFAEPTYAKSKLIGLECWAHVGYDKGDDGKEYSRVNPLHYDELPDEVRERVAAQRQPTNVPAAGEEIEPSEIPF